MANPTLTPLKFKEVSPGNFSLLVDPVVGAEYVWQFCKVGTADWKELKASEINSFSFFTNTAANKGDKYRCLIRVKNKTLYYTKVLTIGVNSTQNKNDSSYYQSQQQSSDKGKTPSVADTDGMDGFAFEQYCANVLRKNGFKDVHVTQGSGDFGIDILAKKDSVSYAIQCKCYASSVGNKAVQEAYSGKSFYHCMVAAVLTNNYFTEAAKETAKRNSVILWDRNYLDNMIKNPGRADQNRWQQEQQRQERERQERQRQERERQERARSEQEQQRQRSTTSDASHDFFRGCTSWEQVRDRYRKLMQMYHPDHESGDEEYAKAINAQYEKMKQKFNQ